MFNSSSLAKGGDDTLFGASSPLASEDAFN